MTLRLLALTAAAPLLSGATPPTAFDMPAYEAPARQWRSVEDARVSPENCRDRIQQVREANGQPQIQRETASPDEPLLIAAVDQRIDGCSVMVMHHDTSDVRPLPVIDNKLKLISAR